MTQESLKDRVHQAFQNEPADDHAKRANKDYYACYYESGLITDTF